MFLINFFKKDQKRKIFINILTRTSNRPKGFKKCHTSITSQTFKNFRHIVSFDNEEDLNYLKDYNIDFVNINRKKLIEKDKSFYSKRKYYSPHNLYCNYLLDEVEKGWVMFLDDDDMLANNYVLEKLKNIIENVSEKTLIIWQMEYPDGKVLPGKNLMDNKILKMYNIGSPCFLFHSRYAKKFKWDSGKCADFRFLQKLYRRIPNNVWIEEPLIKLNNFGDLGNQNDI